MKLNVWIRSVVAVSLIAGLGGCETINTMSNLRDGYQATQTFSSVNAAAEGKPLFAQHNTVRVESQLNGKDADGLQEKTAAFNQNLQYVAQGAFDMVELDVRVCVADCPANIPVIQFRESDPPNWFVAFLMGRDIRGELLFLEDSSLKDDVALRNNKSYEGLFGMIRASVLARALSTSNHLNQERLERGEITEEELKIINERMVENGKERREVIHPDLRGTFGA